MERLCANCDNVTEMKVESKIVNGFVARWEIMSETCPLCGHKTQHKTRTSKASQRW